MKEIDIQKYNWGMDYLEHKANSTSTEYLHKITKLVEKMPHIVSVLLDDEYKNCLSMHSLSEVDGLT